MADGEKSKFEAADYTVFGGSVLLSLLIGIYFAIRDRKNESTENYMFGNRRMPAWAVAFSMAVTFVSTLSMVSFPTEVYLFGGVNIWAIAGQILGISFTSHYYIPFFCKLQISSVFEYLELRFNRTLRVSMSTLVNLQYMVYLGLNIYLPALSLSAVTPIPLTWAILGNSVICTAYTTLGGIKAVVWTDVLQGLIIIVGGLSVFFQLLITVGGFGPIWNASIRGGRMNIFKMDIDPRVHASLPIITIGHFVYSLQSSATSQALVQRYISCKNVKQSQRSIFIKGLLLAVIMSTFVLNGLAMYTYYEGCDPVLSGQVVKEDQAVPLLVVKIFKDLPGMAGLFLAATYCAALSTVSSGVNSIATVILHDFVLVLRPKTSKIRQMRISKLSSLGIGVMITIIAYALVYTTGTMLSLALITYGAIIGPSLAAYLYAFMPVVNVKGAITSMIMGAAFGVWVAIGKQGHAVDPVMEHRLPVSVDTCGNLTLAEPIFKNYTEIEMTTSMTESPSALDRSLYALSPFLIGTIGTLFTVIVGLAASIVTGGNDCSKIDPDYFIPLVRDRRLPLSVLKFFRFGVPQNKQEEKMASFGDFKDAILDESSQSSL